MKRKWLLAALLSASTIAMSPIAQLTPALAQDPPATQDPQQDPPKQDPAEDKPQDPPASETPQEEKPAETQEKPAEEKPAEEKPAEEKPAAETPAAETPEPAAGQDALEMEVVSDQLYNPCGIAIQPDTGTLFVADSGNRQVLRMLDGKLVPVITDFPEDIYGKGPEYAIGPLGMCFLDKDTLVIGGGGMKDGEELLRVYKIPAADQDPIKADQMENSMALPAEGDVVGEGNFYAVTASEAGVFVTLNGDDAKGWIGKATREGSAVKDFKRFIATKESVQTDAPVGICLTHDGYLAVGQMGEISVPGDSLLLFFHQDGAFHGSFETGLSDITSLAYSAAGHLYALDFSWHDTTKGGLFRLVAEGENGCIAKPMMTLDKPTAMVFDQEGNLWVTVVGTAEGDLKGGKLIKIKGLPNGRN